MIRLSNSESFSFSETLQPEQQTKTPKIALAFTLLLMAFLLYETTHPDFNLHFLSSLPQWQITPALPVEQVVDKSYNFIVPKRLWLSEGTDHSYLTQLITANNKRIAKESTYEHIIVTRENFRSFLSDKVVEKIEAFMEIVKGRVWGKKLGQARDVINTFILLNILQENGGIMTDGKCAFPQGFGWVNEIVRNKFVNRANRGIRPRVVGFYSALYTLDKVKENIRPFEGMLEVDRYTAIFPSLQPYFIAADKDAPFIAQLITTIVQLFKAPQKFNRHSFQIQRLKGDNLQKEFFHISVQIVLQNRQKQLDSSNKDQYRHFAMDHYGLSLINSLYGPLKQDYFWIEPNYDSMFKFQSKYPIQEYNAAYGPIQYALRFTYYDKMNSFLEDARDGRTENIWKRSYIQRLFFPNTDLPFIKQNPQKPFINSTNEPWTTLPKIIWVFYDTGVAHAPIHTQICVQNLKRITKSSGFEVREVNYTNHHLYLDQATLNKIHSTMKNAKLRTYGASISDLYRLALIKEHGGIYFDSTQIPLENFDWLLNIGRQPSQNIFNRYGHLPKVFLAWFGRQAAAFEWQIDQKSNTKSGWHLSYESNLIAAEKGSELIRDWFELFTSYYLKDYSEVSYYLRQVCKISEHQWMRPGYHYLWVMDSVKCVVGNKQIALMKEGKGEYTNACDYYKLWSVNGFMGQQKIRDIMNYEHPWTYDQTFVYRYSQDYVEEIIGKIHHLTKIFSGQRRQLDKFVLQHMDGNFTGQAHPDSIFMRYIWRKEYKVQAVDGELRLVIRE